MEGNSVQAVLHDKVLEVGDKTKHLTTDARFSYRKLSCASAGATILKVTVSDLLESPLSWYITQTCALSRHTNLMVYISEDEAASHSAVTERWKSLSIHIAEAANESWQDK